MRLLVRQDGQLRFVQRREEPYAILSHTWGQDEVTFKDVCEGRTHDKVDFLLNQAARDGYQHVWIDTCCIDKSNIPEVGESINLMWEWYKGAAVCYVYLTDVPEVSFTKSRWFTRGWTLQELVAPEQVMFFDAVGKTLGTKQALHRDVLAACGIDVAQPLDSISIVERYKWSLGRNTTKVEDASYCLLGLLEVSIIFNYGERDKARERLLQEVESEHGRRAARDIRALHEAYNNQMEAGHREEKRLSMDDVLSELKFAEMDSRRQTIRDPYKSTCRWILEHEDFRRWSRGEIRLIWLKGRPGTGKSTIMKFIESRSNGISFFYNARGTFLEHSTIGMYRSLLYQLVKLNRELKNDLLDHINRQRELSRWSYTIPCLRATLKLGASLLRRPLQCFVDALDECKTDDIQEMVEFFEDIDNVQVCFASRYYPTITIRGVQLLLERQYHSDLESYVNDRLVPAELRQEVVGKANGVFFWAVLVVRRLNYDYDSGNMDQARRTLRALPQELAALLQDIILPGRDSPEFRLCLSLLLCGQRQFTLWEFYDAMQLGSVARLTTPYTTSARLDSRQDRIQLEKFVWSCSRGLAEVTKDNRVQFIHETVVEYFTAGGLKELYSEEAISEAHEQLKIVCQRCLDLIDYNHASMSSLVSVAHYHYHLWTTDNRWFVDYALRYILRHAEKTKTPQEYFLRSFDYKKYSYLCNKIGYRVSEYSDLPTLIHALAAQNLVQLIHAAHAANMLHVNDVPATALCVAIWQGNGDAACTLIDCGVQLEAVDIRGNSALFVAIWSKQFNIARYLLDAGSSPDAGNSPAIFAAIEISELYSAFGLRCARLLVERGAKLDALDCEGNLCLYVAASRGCSDIVDLLAQHGLAFEARDDKERTALLLAVDRGNYHAAKILLVSGADVGAQDGAGMTALLMASKLGHIPLVRLLLEYGANLDERYIYGQTALHKALDNSEDTLSEYLLFKGIATGVQDVQGKTVLMQVVGGRHRDLAERILSHQPNIEARDWDGMTALLLAASRHDSESVELLLEAGADVQARNSSGATAILVTLKWNCMLDFRSFQELERVLMLLVKYGADLEARGPNGMTALQQAGQWPTRLLFDVLVALGASVDTQNNTDRPASKTDIRSVTAVMSE